MPTRISDELFERGMKYARPGNNQNGRQFPTHRHMPDESNLVREAKETYAFNEDEFVPCDAIGAGASGPSGNSCILLHSGRAKNMPR